MAHSLTTGLYHAQGQQEHISVMLYFLLNRAHDWVRPTQDNLLFDELKYQLIRNLIMLSAIPSYSVVHTTHRKLYRICIPGCRSLGDHRAILPTTDVF